MKKGGHIFIISAPSGCGKTTLIGRLLNAGLGLSRSTSFTTRKQRRGEVNKKDYYFITLHTFENMKRRGGFLEWAKVINNYYGTPRKFVESKLKACKDVLLNIDVKGAMQVKRKCPDAVSIFLLPPSLTELNERLKRRSTETKLEIKKRLSLAKYEITKSRSYDYRVVNDNIERALEKIIAIIIAHRRKEGN